MSKIFISKYLSYLYQNLINMINNNLIFPSDAYSFEVFAIKDSVDSPTGKQAFIGYKISNGNFHFVGVPYTEPIK